MNILQVIFPTRTEGSKASAIVLVARVVFSFLLATHGYQKLMAFNEMAPQFGMLGMSGEVALSLAIFGELCCSIAVIFGFLTRLALIPMIFTMCVAFFVAHGASVGEGELSFVYLVVYVLLWIAGPGKYSIDTAIGSKLAKR